MPASVAGAAWGTLPAGITPDHIADPERWVPKTTSDQDRTILAHLRAAYQSAHIARVRAQEMMNDPAAVAAALTPLLGAREFEAFLVIPLDCRCRAIDVVEISRGDVDGCEAFPRKVVQAALAMGATSAIVAHNHPTGVSLPSAADAAVTRRLAQALRTLDCPLDDHLVIARGGAWTSLRQQQPHLFVG